MAFRRKGTGPKLGHRARLLGLAAAVMAVVGIAGLPASVTFAGLGSAGVAAADTTDSITPTATSVYAGQTLAVNFTYASADANLGAWIGLYAPGNTPGNQASSVWEYVNGNSDSEPSTGTPVTSGTVTLSTSGLAPGNYTLYEFKDDGYDIVGSQVTITILPPALATTTATVTAGQSLTFSYVVPSGDASLTNWVGLYDSAGSDSSWDYTQNDSHTAPTSGTPSTTGTVTLSTTGLAAGTYTAKFLYNGGYTLIGEPVTITVKAGRVAVPGTLTALNGTDSTSINSGAPLPLAYTIPSSEAASSNTVALYNQGADPTEATPLYSFNTAASGSSGTITFDSTGLQPGTYDAYLQNSAGSLFQTAPVVVTVTGDSPQLPSPGQLVNRPNLIVNGGAEIGTGSLDGLGVTSVPGWTVTGLFNEVQYDASDGQGVGGWPTFSSPGSADRGQNYFAGGGGGVSTATQYVNLAPAVSQIDQGHVTFNLGAWIGGTGSLTENATVTARFLNPFGSPLGTATLNPVTPAQRNDATEFLPENATGTIPRGTARVEVVITVNGDHLANRNAAGQGYVDNLSFTVSSDAVQAPAPPTPPVAHVPHFDHVFVVMMENEDYADIIGNSAAPYLNSLLAKGTNLTNMYATAHPSDENYTAFAAGTTGTQEGNTTTAELDDQQIGDLISNAGGTWRSYTQDANGPCDRGSQDTYTIDDTPFINFKDVSDNQASCQEHEQPLTQLPLDLKQTGTTPTYSWFEANDCDDMEGCGITAGDTWLSQTLPTIFNSPAWTEQHSLLIITWDEDAADGQTDLQKIPTLILGSQGTVKQGFSTDQRYTEYGLLRTIEAGLNLPNLTENDLFADPVNDVWARPQRGQQVSPFGQEQRRGR
jgi:Phosphoesterase family